MDRDTEAELSSDLLASLLFSEDLAECRRLLERHPVLLGERADTMLRRLDSADEPVPVLGRYCRALLARCREAGIDDALSELAAGTDLAALVPPALRGSFSTATGLMARYVAGRDPAAAAAANLHWDRLMAHPEFPAALSGVRLAAYAMAGQARVWSLTDTSPAEDFERARTLLEKAIAGLPERNLMRAGARFDLGQCLFDMARVHGPAESLDEAHRQWSLALASNPMGHPVLDSNARLMIGKAAGPRHDRSGRLEVLVEAEEVLAGVIEPPTVEARVELAKVRAALLQRRFARHGEREALDAAREILEGEVARLGPDTPGAAELVRMAAIVLLLLSARDRDRDRDRAAIRRARELAERAVSLSEGAELDKARFVLAMVLDQYVRAVGRDKGEGDGDGEGGGGGAAALDELVDLRRALMNAGADGSEKHDEHRAALVGTLCVLAEQTHPPMWHVVAGHLRGTLALLPTGSEAYAEPAIALGRMLRREYERTGRRALLDEALALHREVAAVAAAVPAGDLPAARTAVNLADTLLASFRVTGEPGAVEESERVLAELVRDERVADVGVLAACGRVRFARYLRDGSAPALDQAIDYLRRASASAAEDITAEPTAGEETMDRLGWLVLLGGCLHLRHADRGDPADLANALETDQEMAALGAPADDRHAASLRAMLDLRGRLRDAATYPSGDPRRHAVLGRYHAHRLLGISFHFEPETDLEPALHHLSAAQEQGVDRAEWAQFIPGLHDVLLRAYNRVIFAGGGGPVIARLVPRITALRRLARGLPEEQAVCEGAALVLQRDYLFNGTSRSLAGAFDACADWLALAAGDASAAASARAQLGALHLMRYERGGAPDDLELAVRHGQAALAATGDDHPDLAQRLMSVANALKVRYRHQGDRRDIDDAISCATRALRLCGEHDVNRPNVLAIVAACHHELFEHTGDPAALDRTIHHARLAQALAPYDAQTACHLSFALEARFEQTEDHDSLNEAVEAARHAVRVAGPGDPELPRFCAALSTALRMRFRYAPAPDAADLDEAVDAAERSVRLAPPGHAGRPVWEQQYALALRTRYEHGRAVQDIDRALAILGRAREAAGLSAGVRAQANANYSTALLTRFALGGAAKDAKDLDGAAAALREVLRAGDAGDPRTAMYRIGLADVLLQQAANAPKPESTAEALTEAYGLLRSAARTAGSPTPQRLRAAVRAARIAARRGDWAASTADFGTAISLLPQVAGPALRREGRHDQLRDLAGLAGDAAAAALNAGEPDRALELLEQGRGVLLAQELDARSDLTVLRERHPGLADELEGLRVVLSAEPSLEAADETTTARDRIIRDRRHQADRRWRELVGEIREREGFEDFLRPPTVADLAPSAARAPVVAVNLSDYRCDALILDSGSSEGTGDGGSSGTGTSAATDVGAGAGAGAVSVVPLSDADPSRLADLLTAFEGAGRRRDVVAAAESLDQALDEIGRTITEPVLHALGFDRPCAEGDPLPHVQWLPTGLLAFLPLHASRLSDGDRVLDRVVSSSTVTIRALHRSQTRPGLLRKDTALVVATDEGDLPNAPREAMMVAAALGSGTEPFIGAAATLQAVSDTIAGAGWAHFACHGRADVHDPSRSALLLSDGELPVTDVTRLDITAHLAFLSACSTAAGSGRLPDEALHLASAFQLAGFRHVVGTLWQIDDDAAYRFAESVYASLKADPHQVAAAVHNATRLLRTLCPPALMWAAHIHFGPS